MESFEQRIRRLRQEAFGDTYRAADKATGISASSWANWETKGTQPYGRTLQQLAAALSTGLGRRVTTDELLTGERAAPAFPLPTEPAPPIEQASGTALRRRRGRDKRSDAGSTRRSS